MAYNISYGDEGTDVRRLQLHLLNKYGAALSPDGMYGPNTRDAVSHFQTEHGLSVTGRVDEPTFDALANDGIVLRSSTTLMIGAPLDDQPSQNSPRQPSSSTTMSLFGEFAFNHSATPGNPERIEILGGWVAENIVNLRIRQLDGCSVAAGRHYVVQNPGTIRCHKKAAPAFLDVFGRWEAAGLMDRVLTCAGTFNARLKRGAKSAGVGNLSNHSWGTAIDLNNQENPLGHVPIGVGERGCVRELVEIANNCGFFWGGNYSVRPDGMHFELAQLSE